MSRRLLLALIAASVAGPALAAPPPAATVETGRLAGIVDPAGVRMFRGIPFAAPPVGPLRWVAPQPAAHWHGRRDASSFGARCLQRPLFSDMQFRSPTPSEDCLFLNVWQPPRGTPMPRNGYPVLLFFYGGGFDAGDSSEKRYDGAALARHGIVVVTANYRLDVFGWMAHPLLTAESPAHASGNYGLLDQVAALKWLRRNAAAFGGNPRHITIGGESAGSISVSALMASPLSRGLIAGAIGESGGAMEKIAPPSRETAEREGVAFTAALGATTLDAMRALTPEALMAARDRGAPITTGIIVDGLALTELPAATFAAGRAAHVPLLVGTNSQEAGAAALLDQAPRTVAAYRAALARAYGARADALFALYPARSDDEVTAAATALAGDDFLGVSTWRWFDLQRRTGAPTYWYQFARVRPPFVTDPADKPREFGAVHSGEIEYALGNLAVNPLYRWEPADRAVSRTMLGYWANFVKRGDPNGAGLPRWPRATRDPGRIERQRIDVVTRRTPFVEQRRYEQAAPLLSAP
ncbi:MULTISPECIES: carboxylesterase/lipase family protein [Sphingomonas]|uniref:carboxylesterase/lipase family protein n=1 Tax=Sphingomonas TaxID=13687 RepID=UPI0019650646|nr:MULTISPECIES: carboxylesterase family protein [Sphingomonas]